MTSKLTHILTSLPILFSLLLSAPNLTSAGRCNTEDKNALLAIDSHLGNPYFLGSWNNNLSCCDWYGVTCDDQTGRVTVLVIQNWDHRLSGTIPPSVGDLPHLQELDLHKLPYLVGPIPPAIANLKKLSSLTISWTNISGPVPSFLSNFPNLEYLSLSFNKLSGAIPPSLGDLTKLSYIDISRNFLTGTLPSTLFQKSPPELRAYLHLSHNNLTGEIPLTFGKIDFAEIDLSRNRFSGDASMLFGLSKQNTDVIDLSRNGFAFDLSKVEFPVKELMTVNMDHNMIYGSIPKGVVKVWNLQFFNVSYNRLCGEIPSGGRMGGFDQYCYLHNKCLCAAPLPPCN